MSNLALVYIEHPSSNPSKCILGTHLASRWEGVKLLLVRIFLQERQTSEEVRAIQ